MEERRMVSYVKAQNDDFLQSVDGNSTIYIPAILQALFIDV